MADIHGDLTLVGVGRTWQVNPSMPATLGRDATCDVQIEDERVSRHHATVFFEDGWWVADARSTNGTMVDDVRVVRAPLRHESLIRLGVEPSSPGLRVSLPHTANSVLRVGRDPANDVVVDSLLASRFHLQVESPRGVLEAVDLDSFNGTFVNGRQIERAVLIEGDIVEVGDACFAVRGGTLVAIDRGAPHRLIVDAVSYVLPNGPQLVDSVSFSAAPNSLTAVIGPSGAGKSSLLRVLSGGELPTSGRVTYEGRDLHGNQALLRHRIGVVPQDDVIHRPLTARSALTYAAELRFPPDLSKADRRARVDDTLTELAIMDHAHTPVGRMSGGQRKRTSVALELLTSPSLLFLDEPTSGLDPGLDKLVMNLLRELANGGRTVLVVTHAVSNLSVCDNVLILAPGGKVAYHGPPAGVLEYFAVSDYADVFTQVAADPEEAQRRFAATSPPPAVVPAGSTPLTPPPALPIPRQMWTVARRQLRIMASDRSYAMFNGLLPIALAVLTYAVPGASGLSMPTSPSSESMQILVILIIGATFMGMSATVRDLVGERTIHRRERAMGLDPQAYLGAKVLVFGAMSMLQALVLVGIVLLRKPGPDSALIMPWPWAELSLVLAATAFVGALAGLLVSAWVGSSEQAMPVLVVAVMAQLVLCGGLIPVTGRPALSALALLAPARWGYAAAASSVDVVAMVPQPLDDRLWLHYPSTWLFTMLILMIQGAILLVLTYWRLSKVEKARTDL